MADSTVNSKYPVAIAILVSAILLSVVFGFRSLISSRNAALRLEVSMLKARLREAGISDYIKEIKLIEEEPIDISEKTMIDTDFERYVRRSRQPGLFQYFRSGEPIYQKNVEGLECVDQITFDYQPGKGTMKADVFLRNDTGKRALPKFQILLFDSNGKLIAEESVICISKFLRPDDTKLETVKFKVGNRYPTFFEVKELK